jgi:hypothetical protein
LQPPAKLDAQKAKAHVPDLPEAQPQLGCMAFLRQVVQRKLRWNPKKEHFIGDDEANLLLSRPRREGYELPKI